MRRSRLPSVNITISLYNKIIIFRPTSCQREIEMTMTEPVSELDADFLQEASTMIKTMGHPDRLRIVELVRVNEHSVKDIQQALGLSQPVTSQHLRRMYHQGILTSRREGHRVLYAVDSPLIEKILECLKETQAEVRGRM